MCIFAYQVPWMEIAAWHSRHFGMALIHKLGGIKKHMKMDQGEDLPASTTINGTRKKQSPKPGNHDLDLFLISVFQPV